MALTKKEMQVIDQLRRALQLCAAALPEGQAREVAALYPVWTASTEYKEGAYITHGEDSNGDPVLYRVVQNHVSQPDWTPESVPALYACVSLTAGGFPVWSPPSGAHDAYSSGDIVSHTGRLWRSEIDGNTTEPGTDGRWWSVYEEV